MNNRVVWKTPPSQHPTTMTNHSSKTRQTKHQSTNTDTTQTRNESNQTAKYGRPMQSNTDSQEATNTKPQEQTQCPECTGQLLTDSDTQELVCQDCGLVVDDDIIDQGPEWRAYTAEEQQKKSRTGSPLTELRHDKGLTTDIDWKNKDAHGRQLSSEKRKQMYRLRKWDYRAKRDSADDNISYANGEIRRMGSALGVPKNILETAAGIYREAHKNDLLPGRSTEEMASATLYVALRIHDNPRSVDEITSVSRVDRKRIQRAYRYMCEELDIGLKPSMPTDYLPRFATDLNIPKPIERTAERLLEDIQGTHHSSGNDPTVLAASALYAASILHGKLLTQVDIKEECGITEVSIRSNYDLFLTESESSPLTEEDIDTVSGPIQLAKKLHGDISYLSNNSNDSTKPSNLPVVHDDEEGILTYSEIESQLYTCQQCGESFTNLEDLSRHRTRIHQTTSDASDYPPDSYNFECPFCPRITDTYIGLNTHIGHVHEDEKQTEAYTRGTCARDIDEYPTRTDNKDPEHGFDCDHCTNTFETYIELLVHQNNTHDGARNSNDDILQQEYNTDTDHDNLELHFQCEQCSDIFNTYHGLKIHAGREHDEYTPNNKIETAVNPTVSMPTIDNIPDIPSDPTTLIIDGDEKQPLGYKESYKMHKQIRTEFNRFEKDFHPTTKHLTATLLSISGKHIDGNDRRHLSTAVASALYAALQITAPVTGETYTQTELAEITDVSQTLISQGYPPYLSVFDELSGHAPPEP